MHYNRYVSTTTSRVIVLYLIRDADFAIMSLLGIYCRERIWSAWLKMKPSKCMNISPFLRPGKLSRCKNVFCESFHWKLCTDRIQSKKGASRVMETDKSEIMFKIYATETRFFYGIVIDFTHAAKRLPSVYQIFHSIRAMTFRLNLFIV